LDKQIASTHREIRQLQTEMGTRANLRQLERWNGDVLALSAPTANQFLNSEDDISRIASKNLGSSVAPPPAMASVLAPEVQPTDTATHVDALAVSGVEPTSEVHLSKQELAAKQAFTPAISNTPKVESVASADTKPNRKLADIATGARAKLDRSSKGAE
jgi:hypothetical protein